MSSDRKIQVGDLVQLVRTCCDQSYREGGGLVFQVSRLWTPLAACCRHCGFSMNLTDFADARERGIGIDHAPVAWLKRIPGAGELGLDEEGNDLEVDDKRPVADYA